VGSIPAGDNAAMSLLRRTYIKSGEPHATSENITIRRFKARLKHTYFSPREKIFSRAGHRWLGLNGKEPISGRRKGYLGVEASACSESNLTEFSGSHE
jgi:hypothetical protein